MRIIEVISYHPGWKNAYAEEAAQLQAIFSGQLMAIHHIGSTSVPGMAAKPVIDILIEVQDITVIDRCNASMIALGYEPKGEYGIVGRRYFQKGGDRRTHHVHVFQQGSTEIENHLLFRDYMRAHPVAASHYAALKRQLAAQFRHDIEGYVQGKDSFVKNILQQAVQLKAQFPLWFIGSNRLLIVPPVAEDLENQYRLQSNSEVMRYVGNGVRTKEEVAAVLNKAILHQQKHGFSLGSVYEKVSGECIGRAGIIYLGFDDTQPDIEIGYAMLPEYWGKGYATELAEACIMWGWSALTVDRLVGVTHPANKASQHVLTKAGMHYVKQSTYHGNAVNYYQIYKEKM